jgi:hypothetical protein
VESDDREDIQTGAEEQEMTATEPETPEQAAPQQEKEEDRANEGDL